MTRFSSRLLWLTSALLLIAGCTGLAGEPEIIATIPPPTVPPPQPTDVGFPVVVPDLAIGARLYAQHCTECHGPNGAGDGDLVQTGQVQNAGNFTDPATASDQTPLEWFATITNGRIENLMPPWNNAFTEAERWHVALYTYTQHYQPEQIAQGAELWALHCAECHGDTGRGDGPRADEFTEGVGNLLDQASVVNLSDSAIYTLVTEGVGDQMPAYEDELTEAERRAVVAYSRTLSLTNAAAIGLPAADFVAQETVSGAVTGVVANRTTGYTVPEDLEVTLFIFDPEFNQSERTATVGAQGNFAFADVPLAVGSTYVVTTEYRERAYASELFRLEAPSPTGAIDLPIDIYELTEDPEVIEINRLVTQVTAIGESLEVVQVFNFRNTSDRAFTTSLTSDAGVPLSVAIPLPPGAVVAGFGDNPQRYVIAPDQFTVFDTAMVPPEAEHFVQIIYIIDYEDSAIIEQEVNYPVIGPARLLVRPLDLAVTSPQFPPLGQETLGDSAYQSFGGNLTLAAGDVLRYELSGVPLNVAQARPQDGETFADADTLPLIVILILVGQVLVIAGLFLLYTRRRRAAAGISDAALMDGLIRQIAELDAQHESGQIDAEIYQQRRQTLKDRLASLMDKQAAAEG
ncbi:MAG: c-type cytochrome [Chloroflexi bacterium]|nr:c-type cytochrome [Chloroflexota bacterium]